MSNYIRIIYLYLICLITLFMIVGGFINTVNSFAKYCFPQKIYTNSYDKDSNDYDYNNDYVSKNYNEIQNYNQKISNLKAGILSISVLVVANVVFLYHWKRIQNERKELEV